MHASRRTAPNLNHSFSGGDCVIAGVMPTKETQRPMGKEYVFAFHAKDDQGNEYQVFNRYGLIRGSNPPDYGGLSRLYLPDEREVAPPDEKTFYKKENPNIPKTRID